MRICHNQTGIFDIEGYASGHGEAPLRFERVCTAACLDDIRVGVHLLLVSFRELLRVPDEAGDKPAVRSEDLHAVIAPVADIHITIGVNRDIAGAVKLPLALAVTAKGCDELTISIELLHAVILVVGDIHAAFFIDGYAPRSV